MIIKRYILTCAVPIYRFQGQTLQAGQTVTLNATFADSDAETQQALKCGALTSMVLWAPVSTPVPESINTTRVKPYVKPLVIDVQPEPEPEVKALVKRRRS